MHRTVTHGNILHRTVTDCNTLEHTATHCNTLEHAAPHSQQSTLCIFATKDRVLVGKYATTRCNSLQHDTTTHFDTMQHTATHHNILHHTTTHCDTLWHTATYCITFSWVNTVHATPRRLARVVTCKQVAHITKRCNTLQHATKHRNTLQLSHAHCNTFSQVDALHATVTSKALVATGKHSQNVSLIPNWLYEMTIALTLENIYQAAARLQAPLQVYISRCNKHHNAIWWNTLQRTTTHHRTIQHTATHWNLLQHTATHCNTLQHAAK